VSRIPPPRGWIEAAQRARWKYGVQLILERDLGLGAEVWHESDPYDLAEIWPVAYAAGTTPTAFVQDAFDEDYAALAGAQREAEEADEYAAEPGYDEEPE
jgi:hypothetical protein